jgi:outer membrane protein TolC
MLLFFLPLAGMAQQSFTLGDAITYGIKNNYGLLNTQGEVEKSEMKIREVLAIGLPQISASGQFTNYINLPTTVIPANAFNPNAPADQLVGLRFGTDFNVTGTLNASQLLFDGSYLVGLQATRNLANLSRLQLEGKEQDVIAEVAKAYYTAIVADENVKTLESTMTVIEKLYKETKAYLDNGLIESQDVDQLNLTLSNMRNAVNRAKNMRDAAYMSLKLQMGMKLEEALTLSESVESMISGVSLEPVADTFNAQNNVNYLMMTEQVELNRLNMKNEQMKFYPSLNAFFTQQYQAMRNDFDFFADKPWYPATLWGVQLSIPIFSSGMRHNKVQQMRVTYENSQLSLQELEQGLKLQAFMARNDYQTALDGYQLQKESLALAESIQNKTLVKYKQGIASSLDLTQTQNQYLQQQGNYINAVFTLLSAKIALDKINNNLPDPNKTQNPK